MRSADFAPLTFSRQRIWTRFLSKVWRRLRADSSLLTQAMNLLGMRWVLLAIGIGVEVPLEEGRLLLMRPGWMMLSRIPETMAIPIVPLLSALLCKNEYHPSTHSV